VVVERSHTQRSHRIRPVLKLTHIYMILNTLTAAPSSFLGLAPPLHCYQRAVRNKEWQMSEAKLKSRSRSTALTDGRFKMRYAKYFMILGLFVVLAGAGSANAQVRVGVGIGPVGVAVGPVGLAPACSYGYYGYYPYACAPYGYYGPEYFNGGIFIGAGPWFHGFGFGRPGFGRGFEGRGFNGRGFNGRGFNGRGFDGRNGFRGGAVGRGPAGNGFRGGAVGRAPAGGGFHGGGMSHGGGISHGGGSHGGGGHR
jgi:hypothetical protein